MPLLLGVHETPAPEGQTVIDSMTVPDWMATRTGIVATPREVDRALGQLVHWTGWFD